MSDACCTHCRGPLGICRNHRCWHHVQLQALEDTDKRSLKLYSDPTARDAIRNVTAKGRS